MAANYSSVNPYSSNQVEKNVHVGIIIDRTHMLKKIKNDLLIKKKRTNAYLNTRSANYNYKGDIEGYQELDEPVEGKDFYRLPPKWIDLFEDSKDKLEDVKILSEEIKKLCVDRVKSHFGTNEELDNEIQTKMEMAMRKVAECEKSLEDITKDTAVQDSSEAKVKLNMQKSLAIQLQEITQSLRVHQKKMMEYIDDFKKKGASRNPNFEFNLNSKTIPMLNEQNELYQYELENYDLEAKDRSEKIDRLVGSMSRLNELFKQMNRLVIDQGTVLDRIDFNLEKAFKHVVKARSELKKASEAQKNPRANTCVLYLFAANLVFIGILMVKYTLVN